MATTCNLRWRGLLSPEEIRDWVNSQQVPRHLATKFACPGVYRFIFREESDENSAHTPCYVGEAGNIGKRLRVHFRLERGTGDETRLRTRRLRPGWSVRGSIRNSGGDRKLQVLTIEGPVNFCGLIFGPDSIPGGPFADSYLRKMLENWAILASDCADHLYPLNLRGTPHAFRDTLKELRAKGHRRKTMPPRD
jgi:hypothetical protein